MTGPAYQRLAGSLTVTVVPCWLAVLLRWVMGSSLSVGVGRPARAALRNEGAGSDLVAAAKEEQAAHHDGIQSRPPLVGRLPPPAA